MLRFTSNSRIAKMKIVTKINHKPGKEALMEHTPNHVFYIKVIPVSGAFFCYWCKNQWTLSFLQTAAAHLVGYSCSLGKSLSPCSSQWSSCQCSPSGVLRCTAGVAKQNNWCYDWRPKKRGTASIITKASACFALSGHTVLKNNF